MKRIIVKNIMFGYAGKISSWNNWILKWVLCLYRGRVGYNGQNNLEHFGCDLDDAKRFFCQKYVSKI